MTNLHAPMQQSKLQNYNSPRGAEAYISLAKEFLSRDQEAKG